jgi:hypothetical protein
LEGLHFNRRTLVEIDLIIAKAQSGGRQIGFVLKIRRRTIDPMPRIKRKSRPEAAPLNRSDRRSFRRYETIDFRSDDTTESLRPKSPATSLPKWMFREWQKSSVIQ